MSPSESDSTDSSTKVQAATARIAAQAVPRIDLTASTISAINKAAALSPVYYRARRESLEALRSVLSAITGCC